METSNVRQKWNAENTKLLIEIRFSKKYMNKSKEMDSCDMWKEIRGDILKKFPNLENFDYRDFRHRFRRVIREYGTEKTKRPNSSNTLMLKKFFKQINDLSEFCYDYPRLTNFNLSEKEENRVLLEHNRRKLNKSKKHELKKPKVKIIKKTVARKSSVKNISNDISESIYLSESQSKELDIVNREEYKEEMGKILKKMDDIYNLLKNHLQK